MPASAPPFLTRPIVELLGRHRGYGFAGIGVSTAVGNFTQTTADLVFPGSLLGLLDWTRTYNSHSGAIGPLGPGWSASLSASLVAPAPGTAGPVTFNDVDGRVLTFTPAAAGGYTRPQDLPATLTRNADGSFSLSYDFGEVWSFDATGRLASRLREGQQVSLSYDSDDLLVRASHSAGPDLAFGYDANRRLTSVTASDGRAMSFSYSPGTVSDSLLESATLPGGGVVGYQSSGSGQASQISQITDPDGNLIVANTYDADTSAVSTQQFPGGSGATFQYDPAGLTTVTSSPDGGQVTFQADANGRMTQVTGPDGNPATFSYDSNGYLTAATTPGGIRLTQTHDANGNLLTSDWGGATTTWTYDGENRVTSATSAAGGVTSYGYAGTSHVVSKLTQPDGDVIDFSVANGLVTRRTDAEGAVTEYGRNAAGDIVSVTGPLGEVTQFSYDAAGDLVRRTAPSGLTTQIQYDAAGRVTAVTGPDGGVTSYSYSPAGLLQQATDPSGAATSYGYDAAGHLVSMTDPLQRVTSYAYDAAGNLVTLTDPAGNATTCTYDALNRLTGITDPLDISFSFGYDADGRLTAETGPDGTTSQAYNDRGNLVSITRPDGAEVSYEYDLDNRTTSVTGPDGATWAWSYDVMGRPVSVTNPLGAVTRQAWTPSGYLASVTDPLGRTTTIDRDAAGRVVRSTDPSGGVTQNVYDQDGRPISRVTPAGLVSQYRYDQAGRLIAVVDPRGWITRYEYDRQGNRTAAITPSGAIQRWRYDATRQLTETTDPNGSVTQYAYDQAGQLIAITDAKGAVTRFGYDADGREISSTDPLGRTTTRAYDQAANLTAVTDPAGHTVNLEYDKANRLTRRSAGDQSVSFSYDPAARRVSMTDAAGTTRYGYDKAGQLTELTYPDGAVLAAAYDAAGQRTSMTYPGGLLVQYWYDLNGRLTGIHDQKAGFAAYAVDPDGRVLTEELPGRLARRYHYDRGLLSRFTVYRDDHPVAATEFEHDPDGRIRVQRDGPDYVEFGYDPAGQLIRHLRYRAADGSHDETGLVYDAAGNRTSMSRGRLVTRYRYDEADQLLGLAAGDRRAEYRYDSSGRLTHRADGPGHEVSIGYDGFGLPSEVTRRRGEQTERIQPVFDGNGLLTSLATSASRGDEQRSSSVAYRWSEGPVPQILAQRAGPDMTRAGRDEFSTDFSYGYGRVFASLADHAAVLERDAYGSQIRTEQTAAWALAPHYDPFGVPDLDSEPEPAALPRFGFRGELASGSLEYLRARSYDTELGRFTSRDPVTLLYGPANGGNPYAYAANDPVDYGDPLGQLAFPFSALSDILSFLTAASAAVGCFGCPTLPNTNNRESKCFQNKICLRARGYIPDLALQGNFFELDALTLTNQPERAAQASAIHKLNTNRGGGDPVNPAVDWEVSRGDPTDLRSDIVVAGPTSAASFVYEVKAWTGPATIARVQVQLQEYIDTAWSDWNHVVLQAGTELQTWLDVIPINIFAGDDIFTPQNLFFMWGGLPGHVYFARGPKVPRPVRVREEQREPVPRRVPVRVPVTAPQPNPPLITAPQPFHLTPLEVEIGAGVVIVGFAAPVIAGGLVLLAF
jgi:RHS repeat-associated protein